MKTKLFAFELVSILALIATAVALPGARADSLPPPPPAPPQYDAPQQPYAPQQPNAPQQSDTAQPQASSRWPMSFDTADGQVTIYQPQLESFDGNQLLGRAAVSVLAPNATDPMFGAIWMQSRVATDRSARTVQILDTVVTQARFPQATNVNEQSLTAMLQSSLQSGPVILSLDSLLSMLEIVQQQNAAANDLNAAPPKIIFKDHPTVLIVYDGQPRLGQVPNSNLLRAVNTPFFVALDPQSHSYFLEGGGRWFAAPDALGPFSPASFIPQNVAALANSSGYQDPQQPLNDSEAAGVEIMTATEPTEVVWTDGPQQLGTIPNTGLLFVANTSSDVFLTMQNQQPFVLLSGRWYTAPNINGPWAFVPADQLPQDFRQIPPGSEKANVLPFVAGTQQAQDAVADTYIPQTAAIDRTNFSPPSVQYDGNPNFEPVAGTQMTYAVNTPDSVVQYNGAYYCCSQAVWYQGYSPAGPWGLCTRVPGVIYTLPPSCPIYPVRFCYVYGVTPDVLYVGYLPGYMGCYRMNGIVCYGTGYYYRPWIGRVYYPRPVTYGFRARYDAYSGRWGFNVGFTSGNKFSGDAGGWLPSRSDRPSRTAWFGHGGYRPAYFGGPPSAPGYRPDPQRDQFWNVYQRRKDVRPDYGRPEMNRPDRGYPNGSRNGPNPPTGPDRSGPPDRGQRQDGRGQGAPGQGGPNQGGQGRDRASGPPRDDVYTDPQGNIYRRTNDGWQQRQGNQWAPANPPANRPDDRGKSGDNPPKSDRSNPPRDETPAQGGPPAQGGRSDQGPPPPPAQSGPPQGQDRGGSGQGRSSSGQGRSDSGSGSDSGGGPNQSGGSNNRGKSGDGGSKSSDGGSKSGASGPPENDYHARQAGSQRASQYQGSDKDGSSSGGSSDKGSSRSGSSSGGSSGGGSSGGGRSSGGSGQNSGGGNGGNSSGGNSGGGGNGNRQRQ